MSQRLEVLLSPLDLESPYSNASAKEHQIKDPDGEVDVLLAAASADMLPERHTTIDSTTMDKTNTDTTGLVDSQRHAAENALSLALGETSPAREQQADLTSRLHYAAASYLCELETGHILSKSTTRELLARRTTCSRLGVAIGQSVGSSGRSTLTGEQSECMKHTYVYPVEDGRYVAVVSSPPLAQQLYGDALVPILVRTALRGYDVAASVASNTAVPTYFPLHLRLREDAAATQRALQARVRQLERVALFAREASLTARENQHRNGPLLRTIRRMCQQSCPCPLQEYQNGPLRHTLHNLVRAATQATHPAALSGSLVSVGTQSSTKRFHVVAAAAWRKGEPVYLHDTTGQGLAPQLDGVLQEHLRPAAVAVLLDSLLLDEQMRDRANTSPSADGATEASTRHNSSTLPRVQFKCIAMHAPKHGGAGGGPGGTPVVAGYQAPTIRPEEQALRTSAALALAFTNGSRAGWTVSLLLTATPIPFAGTPLPLIISGMHELLSRQLVNPAVLDAMALPRPGPSPLGLCGMQATGFTEHVVSFRIAIRLAATAGRNWAGNAAGGMPPASDACVWSYPSESADVPIEETKDKGRRHRRSSTPSKKATSLKSANATTDTLPLKKEEEQQLGAEVEALLALAGRLQGARGRRARASRHDTTRALTLRHTVFAFHLRKDGSVVVRHAVPSSVRGCIAYTVLVLRKHGLQHSAVPSHRSSGEPFKEKEMTDLQPEILRFTTWALSTCV